MLCASGKPACLSQASVSSLDNVYSLPPVAPLSFHRSMHGNCFTSPVLDLLTYLCPMDIHRCTFTLVLCRTAHKSTTDHCLSRTLHFCPWCCFIFISYTGSNSATPQYDCVSLFDLCEVIPSPFPAVHQLQSVSHWPTWSHNIQDIHSSVTAKYMRNSYFMTVSLSKTPVQSFVSPLFSPVFK